MKTYFITLLAIFSVFSNSNSEQEKKEIDSVINQWHKAASEANFDNYFDKSKMKINKYKIIKMTMIKHPIKKEKIQMQMN